MQQVVSGYLDSMLLLLVALILLITASLLLKPVFYSFAKFFHNLFLQKPLMRLTAFPASVISFYHSIPFIMNKTILLFCVFVLLLKTSFSKKSRALPLDIIKSSKYILHRNESCSFYILCYNKINEKNLDTNNAEKAKMDSNTLFRIYFDSSKIRDEIFNIKRINNGLFYRSPISNYNVSIGIVSAVSSSGSGQSLTSGAYNIAIGYTALYSTTTGNYNVAIGDSALFSNSLGNKNICIGYKTNVYSPTAS